MSSLVKTGVLVHVYNVEDPGWEYVAWGDPTKDKLGSLPLLCKLLLAQFQINQVVIHNGPSQRDGLMEGAYTKQFLLDNLEKLTDFPSLKPLLSNSQKIKALRKQVESILIGVQLIRTSDEIAATAELFTFPTIEHVIQIACGSHAPRCMQTQVAARAEGQISHGQSWSVMASDVYFSDTESAKDTVIFESPHLDYDPMINFQPTAPEVLGHYFSLSPQAKQQFLAEAQRFMSKYQK